MFVGNLDESTLYTKLDSAAVLKPFTGLTKEICDAQSLFSSSVTLFAIFYIIPVLLITLTHLKLCFRFTPSLSGLYTMGISKQEWHKGGCSCTVSYYSKAHTPPACLFPKTKEKETANIFAAFAGRWGWGRNLLLGWAWQRLVCVRVCVLFIVSGDRGITQWDRMLWVPPADDPAITAPQQHTAALYSFAPCPYRIARYNREEQKKHCSTERHSRFATLKNRPKLHFY